MKTLQKIILFVFIGAVFVTCKKEMITPSSIEGSPVFSFTGKINGSPINWQAGVNNYYMYSSFTMDTMGGTGVYSFIGNLQSTTTTANSIQISINDYKVSLSTASVNLVHIDSALSQPVYNYNTPMVSNDTIYLITFTPITYIGTATSYTYSFGDGTANVVTTNNTPVTHTYTASGTYTTSLTEAFSSGNVTMSNPITILKTPNQLWMNTIQSSFPTPIITSTVQVAFISQISGGTPPYTYAWSFGDGSTTSSYSTSDTAAITHVYYDSITNPYAVNLKVTDKNNNSQNYNYDIWPDSVPYTKGLMDYKMSVPTQVINLYALSDVTIQYTDTTGTVYTSDNAAQPNTSSFQITSVSAYKNNLNGNPTKMLTVKFNCTLYPLSGGGTPITATQCTATIAVAY